MKKIFFSFLFYSIFSLFIIAFSYMHPSTYINEVSPRLMNLEDVGYIFLLNTSQVLIWFLLTPFALSVIPIYKFLYSIGQAPYISEINHFEFYFSSLSHGIGELIVSFLVIHFMIKQFNAIYLFIKHNDYTYLKKLYLSFLKKYLPLTLCILFFSSFMEVYISNRIFLNFYN